MKISTGLLAFLLGHGEGLRVAPRGYYSYPYSNSNNAHAKAHQRVAAKRRAVKRAKKLGHY